MADDLAAQGVRDRGALGTRALVDAASWRERLWRLERRPADGMEAVDLLEQAGQRNVCQARLRALVLQAEMTGDWGQARDVVGAMAEKDPVSPCSAHLERLRLVTRALEEHKPPAAASTAAGADGGRAGSVVSPVLDADQVTHRPRVVRVDPYGAADAARVVVQLSGPATYRAGLIRGTDGGALPRLYVDVAQTTFDAEPTKAVGGLVERVRLGRQSDGTRIVLDLNAMVEWRVFYVPEPFRLIVDVVRELPDRRPGVVRSRRLERVVIDPGHGGADPGAIGPRGLREKDVTLDIAHRSAPLIARELGLATLLTRDVDTYVPLDERTARANAFRADLFVSIHCNATTNMGSDGVVTFVLDEASDSAATRVAALENDASQAAASELAKTFLRVQDQEVLKESVHVAELLQRATVASLEPGYGRIPNQGVRRAGFYVLAGAHMPAVLYEVSFISNPDGEVRLNTGDYRQKLANAIVNAIRAYRDGL